MQALIRSTRSVPWRRSIPIGFVLLALLVSACSTPQAPRVYRVGVLSGLDYFLPIIDGFKAGMSEMGYVEGKNIVYDVQKTNFDMEAYRRILQGFVNDKVDLILVFPTEASLEAKAATAGTNIPVLFSLAQIEDIGLVKNVREPGGNITGIRQPGPEMAIKRFEVMRELLPQAKRILVPYMKDYPIVAPQLEAVRPAAAAAGVTLVEAPVASPAELEAALQAQLAGDKMNLDGIMLLAEPVSGTAEYFVIMGKFSAAHKLPIGGVIISVDGYESLFGINVDSTNVGEQAAPLADKILKGIPAGTIPVVSGETFLQINYREAQRLGITVPEGLLSQANKVIK